MVSFSAAQRYQLARAAGWSQQDAITATAISLAEDGSGDPAALSPANSDGSHDLGLWQINSQHWSVFGGFQALIDGLNNARAAFQLWQNRGGFGDWSTFNDGSFRLHLGEARDAAQSVESGAPIAPPTIGPLPSGTPAGTATVAGLPLASAAQQVSDQLATIAQKGQQLQNSPPGGNNLVPVVGQAAAALGGLTASVGGFFSIIGRMISDVTSSRFWWRIALVALGIAAVTIGLVLYVRPPIAELASAAAVAA